MGGVSVQSPLQAFSVSWLTSYTFLDTELTEISRPKEIELVVVPIRLSSSFSTFFSSRARF